MGRDEVRGQSHHSYAQYGSPRHASHGLYALLPLALLHAPESKAKNRQLLCAAANAYLRELHEQRREGAAPDDEWADDCAERSDSDPGRDWEEAKAARTA